MHRDKRNLTLGGESLPRLVKVGFYTGAIDRVKAEGIQEPQKIVSILGDLQKVSYSKYFWLAISSLRLRTSASIS